MANVIPERSIADIKRLAEQGISMRGISRALGMSKKTVKRYYPGGECGCGKPAGHNGWCKHLYAQSPARQAFHASRSGRTVTVPDPIKFSRLSRQQQVYLRWEGKDGKQYEPLDHWEMYGAIGEAARITKRYPPDFKEDVFQELALGALDGRIRVDEMRLAAQHFLTIHFNPRFTDISLDEEWEDGGSKYEHLVAVQPSVFEEV